MALNSDYKDMLGLVLSMSKLLLSDNNYDREVAYEVLITKLDNLDNINRYLFEAGCSIILLNPKQCGLISPNTILTHKIGICYRNNEGKVGYKYI